MEWNNFDFQSLIDSLAIFTLVLGAVLYMTRRSLAAVFPNLLRMRPARALLLDHQSADHSKQSACASCSVAERPVDVAASQSRPLNHSKS